MALAPVELLRPELAPVAAGEPVRVLLAPLAAEELRPVLLELLPVPADELRPAAPAGELELVVVERLAPAALLSPDEVLVVEVLLTPEQGATVGELALVLLGEMVTPATLQFSGICCSMIST